MSYCKEFGKDKVVFASKEDHEKPSTARVPPEDDTPRGLIKADGSINWSCPCLGGAASGPCAFEFREAFSCFHNSKAEIKGSDCVEKFATMSGCFKQYPTLYPDKKNEEDEDKAFGEWDRERLDREAKELDDDRKELDAKKYASSSIEEEKASKASPSTS